MKRYRNYMDAVEVSDTLHEKLNNLKEPKKKPRPWDRYGAAAAVLILMAGVGAAAWGSSGWNPPSIDTIVDVALGREDIPAPYPMPGIATVGPNGPFADPNAPADRTNGGYEVIDGEMTAYYVLPWLDWTDANQGIEADYSLAPPSAVSRDATWDDVRLFAGGEKNMADHLLWNDLMNWDGTLWFSEDGTPCAASLYADGNGVGLFLEVMKGGEVPSCEVLPEEYYETSQWQGVKITALKNSGYMVTENSVELHEKREVSLYTNGTGYKLTLYAADDGWADEVCARFVRYAVDGGFSLSILPFRAGGLPNKGLPPEDAPSADILHPGDPGYIEPFPAPDGDAMTTPYDPGAPAATPYSPAG